MAIHKTKLFLTLPIKNIYIQVGSTIFYILFQFSIDLYYDLHLDHYASFLNVLTVEGIKLKDHFSVVFVDA